MVECYNQIDRLNDKAERAAPGSKSECSSAIALNQNAASVDEWRTTRREPSCVQRSCRFYYYFRRYPLLPGRLAYSAATGGPINPSRELMPGKPSTWKGWEIIWPI